jgi:hypothetical protein
LVSADLLQLREEYFHPLLESELIFQLTLSFQILEDLQALLSLVHSWHSEFFALARQELQSIPD